MRKMKRFMLSGVALGLLLSGSMIAVESLAFGSNDSASGEGIATLADRSQSDFTFSAKRNPNGKVTGSATFRNPSYTPGNGQSERIKIDVTCLKIVDNVAILGGMTKRQNSQARAEAFYFAVQDNGDTGDAFFRGFYLDDDPGTDGDPQRCQSIEPDITVLEPISAGNIEVKAL